MKPTQNVDWSYLAALVDGEGTLSLYHHGGISSSGSNYDSTACRMSIYNTFEPIMKWLVQTFGGVYYAKSRRNPKHKIEYDWRPKGRKNQENFLLGILPYLKIKREQALILLEYIRLPHNNGFDATLAAKRKELLVRIQKLNQRGESVTTNTLNKILLIDNGGTLKIESELMGDHESDPVVTQDS
jgi:hypothetical protein